MSDEDYNDDDEDLAEMVRTATSGPPAVMRTCLLQWSDALARYEDAWGEPFDPNSWQDIVCLVQLLETDIEDRLRAEFGLPPKRAA